MIDAIDYETEYDNSGRVENSAKLVEDYVQNSLDFRQNSAQFAQIDLQYGENPRNFLDIFWPSEDRDVPLAMFIHGGYWQRLNRSAFSHMAKGLNERGIAVALPSYTLAPDIEIDGIINELRRACLMLFQTYERKLTVVGHSAGGHLAACMLATDWEKIHPDLPNDLVTSGMGISGLYDLLPLTKTTINQALGMDDSAAIGASPIRWLPEPFQRFEAWVGGDESSEFHRQSRELAQRWTMLGTPTDYVSVPSTNHFTVIHELTNKKSKMVRKIVDLIKKPLSEFEPPEPAEDLILAEMQDFSEELESEEVGPAADEEPEKHDEDETEETDAAEKA